MIYLSLYLIATLATSMWNAGLRLITDDTQLLNFIRVACEKYLPTVVFKPLVGCVTCMGSVWGTYWLATVVTVARAEKPLRDELWDADEYFIFVPVWMLTMASSAYLGTVLWKLLKSLPNG